MTLTLRDRVILLLLREQGFASFDQICTRFFKHKQNTSERLRLLEKNHYITSINAKSYLLGPNPNSHYFPYLQGLGINPRTKIYFLNQVFRRQFPETNRLIKKDLCLHQLLLNDVRFNFEDHILPKIQSDFNKLIINDPDHKILSRIDITKRSEFTPDLTLLYDKISIAIELERTEKGQNRYQQRFWYFEDSSYTHVIYYYVNEAHLKNLLSYAGLSHKFGFAHYLKPNQILSNIYGFLDVQEWIKKINLYNNINQNDQIVNSKLDHKGDQNEAKAKASRQYAHRIF